MKSEAAIMKEIQLAIGGRKDVRIWRNSVGEAYSPDGRRFRWGLCKGSADLIGFKIDRVAVFVAIEVKAEKGRLTKEQRQFLSVVAAAGGLAGVARSVEDAERIIGGERLL